MIGKCIKNKKNINNIQRIKIKKQHSIIIRSIIIYKILCLIFVIKIFLIHLVKYNLK